MKIREEYIIKKVENETYLLPTGQAIASFRHGVKLNDVGVIFARELEEETTPGEILGKLRKMFPEVPAEQLENDLNSFINELKSVGVIGEEPASDYCFPEEVQRYYNIAGLTLFYTGPESLIFENLEKYESRDVGTNYDQEINVYFYDTHSFKIGKPIVRSTEILIYENMTEFGLVYT
nr:PqqD family protein [Lachnospiraceae bacterium]